MKLYKKKCNFTYLTFFFGLFITIKYYYYNLNTFYILNLILAFRQNFGISEFRLSKTFRISDSAFRILTNISVLEPSLDWNKVGNGYKSSIIHMYKKLKLYLYPKLKMTNVMFIFIKILKSKKQL